MTASDRRIFCALDTTDLDHAVRLARLLGPHLGGVKLGLEFFNAHGPRGVAEVAESGAKIFSISSTMTFQIRWQARSGLR